jgi:hypothetical protein
MLNPRRHQLTGHGSESTLGKQRGFLDDIIVPQAQSLKDSILTFFTMLSVAHTDALTILLESLTLVPSLVLHLTHLMTPFREDDVELIASSSRITSYASRSALFATDD